MTRTTASTEAEQHLLTGFVPFPDDRADHYRTAGYWSGKSLESLLKDAAQHWPNRVAVIDTTASHTFAELDQLASETAAGFAALGICAGDRVLLQLPNTGRFAIALFGLLRAGAVPVMCLPAHRRAELSHFATVSGAVALVIADRFGGFDYRDLARDLVAEHPGLHHVIVDGDAGEFTSWTSLSGHPPIAPPQVNTADPALLLVSGGTTGAPKLIPRTHDDYYYNATASAQLCEMTSDDVYLAVLPAAHNFPLACPGLLGTMSVGATTVFTTDPSPESAFATIAQHRVTVCALVPALATLWTLACDWEPQRPSTLRLLQVGGAKLTAPDAAAARAALTPGLQQVFGMAEGLINYTRPGDAAELLDHTQGAPLCLDDELRVVDDDGADVPPGDEGELLVRGPYTLGGYYRAPSDNERSFSPDGFYRTGDRVRRRADGYLEVTGRIKDVIHRGGETISALDLEEHLLTHPSIRAAAAVPLPDPYLGEKICAVVVFDGGALTLSDVHSHLDARGVAAHSRPDSLIAQSSLPLTAVGKVDKKAIIASLT
ncbi:AMP-binding protein [Mycobacterium sp. CBMA293]|uniref:(2,3-dihydroxybenzoyl)adenylate synthase n=2 Tax=Mycolicibacterium TaxID=1866885 RepID=UPI001324B5E8|nr:MULTISPECIES: AMP-binding protein [unclassified Mycolicibacterium]MUL45719.1 AMP-binding protein [Mycolicibacterium sp. CBMA 360]MUL97014.1 AMP-binding protein [Mycolicibacterium sp. CBMA 230]MUL60390.1 AMP-binding protein [Mycolicibacterium sp. CBMA 335]MUL71398.1 AMP-binding protein [Mycolicibacterium sp. CBMA 311]MUL73177.1 AMP-binding protein [Mycolicibacterium sp. CBMA 311]